MNNHSHRIHDSHRYGLRHSLNHGISRSTDVSIVARHECVPGYGKNCVSVLSGSRAHVVSFLVSGSRSSVIKDVDRVEL